MCYSCFDSIADWRMLVFDDFFVKYEIVNDLVGIIVYLDASSRCTLIVCCPPKVSSGLLKVMSCDTNKYIFACMAEVVMPQWYLLLQINISKSFLNIKTNNFVIDGIKCV